MQMKSLFFCKGKISNIEVLNQFFKRRHADILGQVIILMKSTIFVGSKSHQRLAHVAHLLGFNIGRLPFLYLGVQSLKASQKIDTMKQLFADKLKVNISFKDAYIFHRLISQDFGGQNSSGTYQSLPKKHS